MAIRTLIRRPALLALVGAGALASAVGAQPYVYRGPYVFNPWNPPSPGFPPAPVLLRPAGDWDGDGWPDVGIRWSGGNPGRFRIQSAGTFSVLLEILDPPLAPCGIGTQSVGAAFDFEDITADGAQDLILGNGAANLGPSCLVGNVEIRSGPASALLYTVWGQNTGDAFGADIEAVGNTNGNGIPDFLVKAPGFPTAVSPNAGAVYLVEGADGSLIYQFLGTSGADLGSTARLARMGDIDGDGFQDFAIARTMDGFAGGLGHVEIHSGYAPAQILRDHAATLAGEGFCASSLFSVGDADGDGMPEYVIGNAYYPQGSTLIPTTGRAWLYSGATGAILTTFAPPPNTGQLGFTGGPLDDLDGDGFPEILLGSPLYGVSYSPPNQPMAHIYSTATGALLQSFTHPYSPPVAPEFAHFIWTVNDGYLGFAMGVPSGPPGVGPALLLYDRAYATASPPTPPVGSIVNFDVSLPSQPGAVFHLFFAASATIGTGLASRVFPLDPDGILAATTLMPFLTGTLDATGAATIPIPVPPDPSLSGATLFFGVATFDASYPFGVRSLSTARWVAVQ